MDDIYLLDYNGCQIADYNNTCVVLNYQVYVFGCGAYEARIWHAGTYNPGLQHPDIREIGDL